MIPAIPSDSASRKEAPRQKKAAVKTMRFSMIGGSRQLVLDRAEDLEQVLTLDPALWAISVLPADAVLIDREFLDFIDTDHNQRIRPDELCSAIRWMLKVLKDLSGATKMSDSLRLDAINCEDPEGQALYSSARLVLDNLKCEEKEFVTLAQVRDKKAILASSNQNGDGVIVPGEECSESVNALILSVMKYASSAKDLSGEAGINAAEFDAFLAGVAAESDWRKRGRENLNSLPYGNDGETFFKEYASVQDAVDRFFLVCEGMTGKERFDALLKIDPLDLEGVQKFLQNAPAGMPSPEGVLNLTNWVNPLWKEKLSVFISHAFSLKQTASENMLSQAEWKKISSSFAWREAWLKEKTSDKFDSFADSELEVREEDVLRIRKMLEEDAKVADSVRACDLLKKLILFQQNMLEFVNNFVSLDRLFNIEKLSIIQPGYLILDCRHFTLGTKVTNLAEHKKIIQKSNICVLYAEVSCLKDSKPEKMTLGFAVTAGTMRNIFPGQYGVFVGYDGREWDAKVIDMIQQPVSIGEALKMPFIRFGEFIGKQADKYFSSRSRDLTDSVGKAISTGSLPKEIAVPKKTQQTPAISGSMMLMGGGVGIAALGSAFAFMAKTLKNISVWNVVTVFVILALVIGGPVLTVSIVKLMNRSISYFLAASGWAVNPKMRLSQKLGRIFTYQPCLPGKYSFKMIRGRVEKIARNLNENYGTERGNLLPFLLLILAVLILLAVILYFR